MKEDKLFSFWKFQPVSRFLSTSSGEHFPFHFVEGFQKEPIGR